MALEAARTAGRYLAQAQRDVQIETFKEGAYNYATAQDVEAERIILATIARHFPNDAVLAEESAPETDSAERLWVVDPVDGTRNYANGLPFFAVSISFCRKDVPQVGVVYAPCLNDELFHAVRGGGAHVNGEPLEMLRPGADLASSIVATGFAYHRGDGLKRAMAQYERTMNLATDVNRFGSAALDLCYVAAGRLGAYYEAGLKPWDVAAGTLIVEAAGGLCTNHAGGRLDIFRKANGHFAVNVLASKSTTISRAMLPILQP